MKRILNSIAVLALVVTGAVSCQKELSGPGQSGQEVQVSLDLTTDQIGTRAYADGNTVDVVRVHVYQQDANGDLVYIQPNATTPTPSKDVAMSGGTASYSTRLVTGQTYTFVFWAEKDGNGAYTYDTANKTISVDYSNAAGNDENRDAFYNVLEGVEITGAYSASVQLHRPFAQLNFGTSDYDAAVAAGITVTGAAVKLTNVANSLNLLDGSVSGTETVTFANATLPSETLSAANDTYKYVAMDYVLVGKDGKTLSDVTLTLEATGTQSATPEYTYTSVPLQGNYRTNIIGSLFTSPADIQITVDHAFKTPDENVVVENVASIAAANAALVNGATSINITNVTTSEAEATKLQMPATTESITVKVEKIESTANLQIEQPATGNNPESVSVNLPASASVENLTINLPQSHVEVNGSTTYNSITATTSNNTLVIGEDVTVNTLTVNAGAVEVYGEVGTLTKGQNAGAIKVWAVGDEATWNKAYAADAEIIELKNSFEISTTIEITRSLTIQGNGFEIIHGSGSSDSNDRVVNIKGQGDYKFYNTKFTEKSTGSFSRGINVWGEASGSTILLDGCTVSAGYYALNFIAGPSNLEFTIKNGTVAAGWAAINCYANNSTFNVENSTLKGLNDKGESSWNNFATIVFDGNGLWNTANIGKHGTGNKLNVVNSTIYASSESSNNQAWLALQYGAQRNMIKVDAATRIIDGAGNDQTNNIAICDYVGYVESTGTATAYDHESEIWIGEQNLFPGFYLKDGVYHIANAGGLMYFSDKVNEYNNSYSGKTVVLDSDIDLQGVAFTSIGQTGATQFLGTFDGQNHTISNLSINNTDEGGNCATGLFGWLNSAVVKNVKISGAEISGHHNVGTIAGYLETSGCTIEGCTVENATINCTSVNNDANGDKCGGIVGHAGNRGVLVKNCTVLNSTISAGRDAGQVVGAALEANVVNCSATNVTVNANGTSTGANIRGEVIGRVL